MTTSSAAGGVLCTDVLSFEPVRMVNVSRRGENTKSKENIQQPPASAEGIRSGGASDRLHILELSNVDQINDFYISVALFYDVQSWKQAPEADEGKSGCCDRSKNAGDDPVERLRCALEELLVHYPEAGGRVCYNETEGRLEIQYYLEPPPSSANAHTASDRSGTCGDSGDEANDWFAGSGVPFIGAQASMTFRELGDVSVPHPSQDLLHPCATLSLEHRFTSVSAAKYLPRPVMAIQVTSFTCGGFCLAHTCHHTFLDGHGGATFLQNLCSIARGAGLVVAPAFSISRREVMKPRTPPAPSPRINHNATIQGLSREIEAATGRHVQLLYGTAMRFTFPYAALEALRLKGCGSHVLEGAANRCSRFQALVALLWTARAKSLVASHSASSPPPDRTLNLRIPINLRDRGVPWLTQTYMGNAIFQFSVSATLQELCESPLHTVVSKLKSAVMGMDFQECAQSETEYIELKLRERLVPHIVHDCLGIPSLVGLPFYDTDCGWGCPIYCGTPSRHLNQRLAILDHPMARAWNVLAAFHSQEEHAAFRQEIAGYIKEDFTRFHML